MSPSREYVLAFVSAMYGKNCLDEILAILDEYGIECHEHEVNRVQIAILQLSEGNKDKLRHLVKTAKIDYRDILAWQELGPLSAEEGAKWQAMVKSLLDRWKK